MIEYLRGTLFEKSPTNVVILAGGVGYGVSISLATYERLPEAGDTAGLYTHLAVREDALILFGFAEASERDMFLLLTSVTGVGPKIAIGILSSVGIDTLRENIARGNSAALTTIPGIGKKMAERISLELRDKIGTVDSGLTSPGSAIPEVRLQALAALISLQYNRSAAEKAIRDALKEGPQVEEDVQTLIKTALKLLRKE